MKFTTFGAPSPRNVTLRKHTVHGGLQMTNGTLTLIGALFQEAYTCAAVGCVSRDYNSRPQGPDFNAELIPVHSPLLRESYLVSYPPLTYMLKFSGFADLTSCQDNGPKPQVGTHQASATKHALGSVLSVARQGEAPCTACIKGLKLLGAQHAC